VAGRSDLPRTEADDVVRVVLDSLVDSLNAGEKIELRGFGSFRLRNRGPREGRNPRTGEQLNVPAKRVAYFKPGKLLKRLINP
jgi:integration host factor subunit beta